MWGGGELPRLTCTLSCRASSAAETPASSVAWLRTSKTTETLPASMLTIETAGDREAKAVSKAVS